VNLHQARIRRNLRQGLIQLVGVKIGGELILSGAELENETGPAPYGDRVQVERNLNLRVAGLTDAKVCNGTGVALHADGIKIDTSSASLFTIAIRLLQAAIWGLA
jgi:hypothetical protein